MEEWSRPLTEPQHERREEIIERDDGECQFCGVGEPIATLEVHHIVPMEFDGGDEDTNLVTLCRRCHRALHRLGEGTEYRMETLETAEDNRETTSAELDEKYKDTTPEGWEPEEWESVVTESEAPARATVTVKEINDNRYYYWQWRDGDKIRSEYISPVDP